MGTTVWRWKRWMAVTVAVSLAAAVAVWLLAPRGAAAAGDSEGGYVAATGSLLVLGWCVGYFEITYGALHPARPGQWAVVVLTVAAPFVATIVVEQAQLRAAAAALVSCLEELNPAALVAVHREDRRAR